MRSFLWIVVAGVAWLALVQASPLLGHYPQLVTLARSVSLACYAIFLLLDLRSSVEVGSMNGPQGIRASSLLWFVVPLAPAFVLHFVSAEFVLSGRDVLALGIFYSSQLALLFIRQSAGAIRSARWELLPPVLFAVYLISAAASAIGAVLAIGYLARRLLQEPKASGHLSHALVIQLPSLVLAPAILIAMRDQFDMQGLLPRQNVETIGMIVNGLGASAWMAMVMRAPGLLVRMSWLLWLGGSCVALSLFMLPSGYLDAAVAVVGVELFRGSSWLGTTHVQMRASRLGGFSIGLLAAVLPMCGLLLGREMALSPPLLLAIFAIFYLPLSLATLDRQHKAAAAGALTKAAGLVFQLWARIKSSFTTQSRS